MVKKKVERPGIGAFAMDLIRKGKTNEEVFKAIKVKFPKANTTIGCVGWYRNKLRTDGVKGIKTNRALMSVKKAA